MSKQANGAASDDQVVDFLRALAHPKRFRMVQQLAESGELSCGEVADKFELSQATISHHLKLLVDAGVINMRQDGQHHFLSVNQLQLAQMSGLLQVRLKPARSPLAARTPRSSKSRERAES